MDTASSHASHPQAHRADTERAVEAAPLPGQSALRASCGAVYLLQLRKFSPAHTYRTGKPTKRIPPSQQPIEPLELLRRDSIQSPLVAHNLDLMAILDEIEEYQFAPRKSIRTNPTYFSKYMPVNQARRAYHGQQQSALPSGHSQGRRTECGTRHSSLTGYLGKDGGMGLGRSL